MILLLIHGLASAATTQLKAAPPASDEFEGPRGVGLGLVLGIPTGLSAAYRPADLPVWMDGAAAWSFETGSVALHADVLVTVWRGRDRRYEHLHYPVYLGIGPRFRFGDAAAAPNGGLMSIRIPIGFAVWHDAFPVEGFAELAPGVGLIPSTRAVCDVAIGARVYLPGSDRSADRARPAPTATSVPVPVSPGPVEPPGPTEPAQPPAPPPEPPPPVEPPPVEPPPVAPPPPAPSPNDPPPPDWTPGSPR